MASYLQSLLQSAHQTAFRAVLRFVEAELVPDFIVRRGIRYLLSIRLREVRRTHSHKCAGEPVHPHTAFLDRSYSYGTRGASAAPSIARSAAPPRDDPYVA